jgi:hypothetical protein
MQSAVMRQVAFYADSQHARITERIDPHAFCVAHAILDRTRGYNKQALSELFSAMIRMRTRQAQPKLSLLLVNVYPSRAMGQPRFHSRASSNIRDLPR